MHRFVAIVLNFNHTTVYANCVIAYMQTVLLLVTGLKYISVQTLKVQQ